LGQAIGQEPSQCRRSAKRVATGFRSTKALVISFSLADERLPALQVGDIEVSHIAWHASGSILPSDAATMLVEDVSRWLEDAS
jgi:hypothetical protein